jgi:hypothetical protein
MDDSVPVRMVIEVALAEDDLEARLEGLIRVAFRRREVLVTALHECRQLAAQGSDEHALAADRIEQALGYRSLWGAS